MPAVVFKILVVSALAIFIFTVAIAAILEYVDIPTPYSPGSSPINPGQFGTSMFIEMLRDYGMRVVYISNWSYVGTQRFRERICILIVSPEYSYTDREANAIAELLANSGGILVVADETTTSNTILKNLGLRAEVYGNRLLDEYYDLYPRAVFHIGDRELALRLDKASEVHNCSNVVGVVESYELLATEVKLKPVGCLERVGSLAVLILGDGSLLTNQVQQLGGAYKELSKYVVLAIREHCGVDCVVLVEAGKYVSNRNLFLKLYTESKNARLFLLLNDVAHRLKSVEEFFEVRLLEGLEEETIFTLVLLAMTALSAKLGRGVEIAEAIRNPTWKSREDFKKLYSAIIDVISLLGCESLIYSELIRCLEKAGYDFESSRKLARFIEFSNIILNQEFLRYIPVWRFMINSALRHSEKLLEVLEKSFLREEVA